MAILFIRTPLPVIVESSPNATAEAKNSSYRDLLHHKLFLFAVVAQFFYVAAQTGIGSFFINYVSEIRPDINHLQASSILALGGMGLFMLGRMLGSFLMKIVNPKLLLSIFASVNIVLMAFVMMGLGVASIICLFCSYLFMSIMFPTIFALGISDMGSNRERASSILVMCVVGGAVVPILMGYIADVCSMAIGFVVPMVCFVVILAFGLSKAKN
jgi:FHS family L-fucose permease-like MFS transporter